MKCIWPFSSAKILYTCYFLSTFYILNTAETKKIKMILVDEPHVISVSTNQSLPIPIASLYMLLMLMPAIMSTDTNNMIHVVLSSRGQCGEEQEGEIIYYAREKNKLLLFKCWREFLALLLHTSQEALSSTGECMMCKTKRAFFSEP